MYKLSFLQDHLANLEICAILLKNGEKWQMYQICTPASWNITQFKSECTVFYPNNQNTEYKTKFHLRKGLYINVFRKIFAKIEKWLKFNENESNVSCEVITYGHALPQLTSTVESHAC